MEKDREAKRPNELLRNEREKRGWSQSRVADLIGADTSMVSRWECGNRKPDHYYQERLCDLFGKNAIELGFIRPRSQEISPSSNLIPPPLAAETSNTRVISSSSPDYSELIFPKPPHPYLAHPYALQQNFIGRYHERAMLSEWLSRDTQPILVLTALGGMGKSALAWVWLQQDVQSFPAESQPDGIIWWSFYEPEAPFTIFLNHALAYLSHGRVDAKNIPSLHEKTQTLINLLLQGRYLLILDGFERELREYTDRTNAEAKDNNVRICTDPFAGSFLRWLASGTSKSKVLITTRLFPQELDGLAGCQYVGLSALATEDALNFCRAQGVNGTRAEIQATCTEYGYHPLALRLLTGLIANDPARPGDVSVAVEYSPLDEMTQREHHVLKLSYEALHPPYQQLLSRVAAFRGKAKYEMVRVISPFESEGELKAGLRELIERGLLLFDRVRVCYELHPIVRQYAYARLAHKSEIHASLASYFQSQGMIDMQERQTGTLRKIGVLTTNSAASGVASVGSVEDLATVIETYHHLLHAGQLDQAFEVYTQRLAYLLHHRLGAYSVIIELLQAFLNNHTVLPQLAREKQSWILDALANAYSASGHPERAVQLLQASIEIDRELGSKESLATALWNLSVQLQVLGRLVESERCLQECIETCQDNDDSFDKAKAHQYFALLRAYQGHFEESSQHLQTALSLFKEIEAVAQEGAVWAYQALCSLLAGKISQAVAAAHLAREMAEVRQYERDIIRAEWLLGSAYTRLALGEDEARDNHLQQAEWHLREALRRCRQIDMVDYEADLLLSWAQLHHARGEQQQAQECVTEALAIANRSDFRVLRADIHNFLALLELERGNGKVAMQHAESALIDAACDGHPYCYKVALNEAERLLDLARRQNGEVI